MMGTRRRRHWKRLLGGGVMRNYVRTLSPKAEFIIVVFGAFGWFWYGSILWLFESGDGAPLADGELQSLISYELIVTATLCAFLRLRGWTAQGLGLQPNLKETLAGLGLTVAIYATHYALVLVADNLDPELLPASAERMALDPDLSLITIIAISVMTPCFEEIFVCGYVISRLNERGHMWTAINVSVAIRLSYHVYQGIFGVISIIPIGLLFAYWYVRKGRLWPMIVAHALLDFFALLLPTLGQ